MKRTEAMRSTKQNSDVIDRAAEFVARAHSGHATEGDRRALSQWLAEDSRHETEYRRMLDTWHLMGSLADCAEEAEPSTVDVRVWVAAASLVLALGLGILLGTMDSLWGPQSHQIASISQVIPYETEIGEQKTVELTDGSIVTLNTNTRILVDFTRDNRRTVLERGEAFYDITANPDRPFIVDTGARAVTVLGTRFNVLKSAADLEVAVVQGVVAVHPSHEKVTSEMESTEVTPEQLNPTLAPGNNYRLKAGIVASFSGNPDSDDQQVVAKVLSNPDHYPRWRYGSLRFKNQPLAEVVADLNRYIRTEIQIEGAMASQLNVTGVFHLESVEDEIQQIEKVLPVTVTRYDDKIVISSR